MVESYMVPWGRFTDEWGDFTDVHDLDAMLLEQEGVIQAIRNKNSAIYNVVMGSYGEKYVLILITQIK